MRELDKDLMRPKGQSRGSNNTIQFHLLNIASSQIIHIPFRSYQMMQSMYRLQYSQWSQRPQLKISALES